MSGVPHSYEEGSDGRRRPRSDPTSPRDRPSSLPRREELENGRGSLVLSTSSINVPSLSAAAKAKARGAAVGWAIPSSSRCVVCGRLTCICDRSTGGRLDREAVQRRLEQLRVQTPYERAKLMRASDELRQEEVRRRGRCADAWLGSFLQLQALELAVRQQVSLQIREQSRRAAIATEETRAWAMVGRCFDGYTLVAALTLHERGSRQALVAAEGEQRLGLEVSRQRLRECAELLDRESCVRLALACHEAAERDGVHAAAAETRRCRHNAELARMTLWRAYEEGREHICCKWVQETEALATLGAVHARLVGERLWQRGQLFEEAIRSTRGLKSAEATARRELRDAMYAGAALVVERAQHRARACESLARAEAVARLAVAEEATAFFHAAFLERESAAEEVAERVRLRERRREAEAHTAVAHMQSIAIEEADAFEELLAWERRERSMRQEWIAARLVARGAFAAQAIAELQTIAAEEVDARRALGRAAEQSEVDAATRHAQRDRRCRELMVTVVTEKDELRLREHDARFRLISRMAEEAEAVRRWRAAKAAAVAGVVGGEETSRAGIAQKEEAARDTITVSFTASVDALAARARDAIEALVRLQHQCVAAREALLSEEAGALAALQAVAAMDRGRAMAATSFRGQLALQHAEGDARVQLVIEEASVRSALDTTRALAVAFVTAEEARRQQAAVSALVQAERAARGFVVRATEEAYADLRAASRDAELRVIKAQEARIAEELRAQEQCLAEDGRLYVQCGAEEEALPGCDTAADGAARARDNTVGPAAERATRALRRQLVWQALGMSTDTYDTDAASRFSSNGLDARAVDYLVAALDGLGARKEAARERVASLEKLARDAGRRAALQEEVYANEREKRAANATRMERDNADRERRLQSDRAERQRGAQQLEVERQRLDEALAQLERRRADLDRLKGSINKQFGRA